MPAVPVRCALRTLGASHATWYRRRSPRRVTSARVRAAPPLALSAPERAEILAELNAPRFADCTPYTAYARLLDEGRYLGSVRTMYRVLGAAGMNRERRNQLQHPAHAKPELTATDANQVWSWDITRIRGSLKWQFFYLYVLIDIFSRYVVGWVIARAENAGIAQALIEETCLKYGLKRDSLILHSDRGSPMRAKGTAELLVDMGVAASFSRPRVSNDNPFSEAHFKTLKYRPEFPRCFESIEHARAFLRTFFAWYNEEHRHSGIGFMTPAAVHFGHAGALHAQRARVLAAAYAAHPARFKSRFPVPPELPEIVGINLPETTTPESRHDLTATPELFTNLHTEVSHSH